MRDKVPLPGDLATLLGFDHLDAARAPRRRSGITRPVNSSTTLHFAFRDDVVLVAIEAIQRAEAFFDELMTPEWRIPYATESRQTLLA